ncbi:MAG TPA: hypothetical protein DEP84_08660, partial [Chloroflexi bacterium]|nr:hypothetical protein [Chloroflexota bacterium]
DGLSEPVGPGSRSSRPGRGLGRVRESGEAFLHVRVAAVAKGEREREDDSVEIDDRLLVQGEVELRFEDLVKRLASTTSTSERAHEPSLVSKRTSRAW